MVVREGTSEKGISGREKGRVRATYFIFVIDSNTLKDRTFSVGDYD